MATKERTANEAVQTLIYRRGHVKSRKAAYEKAWTTYLHDPAPTARDSPAVIRRKHEHHHELWRDVKVKYKELQQEMRHWLRFLDSACKAETAYRDELVAYVTQKGFPPEPPKH